MDRILSTSSTLVVYHSLYFNTQPMIFSKTLFLEAFSLLHHPQSKKQANRYILQLEKSEEAWLVGRELLEDGDKNNRLQGALLLSKKTSSGLPTNLQQTLNYLLNHAQNPLTDRLTLAQLSLCIAKLLVTDLNCFTTVIRELASKGCHPLTLSIFKQVPQSILCVNSPITLSQQDWRSYYHLIRPILSQALFDNSLISLSLECLQNLSQFSKVKIFQSLDICQIIVSLPIQQTTPLLLQAFSDVSQNTIDINSLILFDNYIWPAATTNADESFIRMFIDFLRLYIKIVKTQINLPKLDAMVNTTLQYISKKRQYIVQSFYLWLDLETLSKQMVEMREIHIRWSILLIELVMKQSRLKKLIETGVKTEEILIEDVQYEQDPALLLITQNPANSCLSFRECAIDFITICYKSIRKSEDSLRWFFGILDLLSQGMQLDKQLCIFVLKSIVHQFQNDQSNRIYNTLLKLIQQASQFSNDLLIPFLQLLNDSDKVILNNDVLLVQALQLLMKTFRLPNVVRLSTQTLNNLMSNIQELSVQASKNLQNYMCKIYNDLHYITDEVVLQNILGAILALSAKTVDPANSCHSFLTSFQTKVGTMPIPQRVFFYKALFIGHQSVDNPLIDIQLAKFVDIIHNMLLDQYFKSTDKKYRSSIMLTFNVIAKRIGRHNQLTMYQIASKLLQEAQKTNFSQTNSLYFLSNILNHQTNLNNAMKIIWQPLLPKLLYINPRPDLCKIVVELFNKFGSDSPFTKTQLQYSVGCLCCLPFNYQLIRQILRYFIMVIKIHRLEVAGILHQVLLRFKLLFKSFDKQIQNILIEAYRAGGRQIFQQVLGKLKPEILSPNPLFDVLIQSLEQNQGKSAVKVLMCLS